MVFMGILFRCCNGVLIQHPGLFSFLCLMGYVEGCISVYMKKKHSVIVCRYLPFKNNGLQSIVGFFNERFRYSVPK